MKSLDELSYGTMLKLTKAGITTVEQLEKMTDDELRRIRGLGWRAYREIKERLGEHDDKSSSIVVESAGNHGNDA